MATNLQALNAAIRLVADIVNDSVKAAADTTAAAKMGEYANILPDVLALMPQIGDIPAEAHALAPEDYANLLITLAKDLNFATAKAQAVLTSSVKLLSDIATVIIPDVQAIQAALK